MRPRILVLGRNGQLATSISCHKNSNLFDIIASGRQEFDLRNLDQINNYLSSINPDAIINTAAYTDVERAESEPLSAMILNAIAPRKVAEFCEKYKKPLIHISSDYVYDGKKTKPYNESDAMNPISSYGCSKAVGDIQVLEHDAMILRTSWLFSGHNRNFARNILNLSEENEEISIIDDQIGNPTYAEDFAELVLTITQMKIDKVELPNLLLAGGEETASWADLAEALLQAKSELGKKTPKLKRITTDQYPLKARRPQDSRLDTTLLQQLLPNMRMNWRKHILEVVKLHYVNLSKSQ